jgi:hypothetical protein
MTECTYCVARYALLITTLLLAACAPAAVPTATPLPTLVPSLTPTNGADIQAAVEGTLTALSPTLEIQLTEVAATPEATPTEDVIQLPPVLGKSTEPPMDITLPVGWKVAQNDALIIPDADGAIRSIPFVAYSGPITGGQGTIVLLWGFPSLVNPFANNGTPSAQDLANLIDPSLGGGGGTPITPDLWSDGLRLLRLAIVEQGCNVGTDLKRTYTVGTLSGVGTQFAAVQCPQLPDTRGWFVGVPADGLNFIFYMFSDPIQAMDTGRSDLQAVLDTVHFHPLEVTPEATP